MKLFFRIMSIIPIGMVAVGFGLNQVANDAQMGTPSTMVGAHRATSQGWAILAISLLAIAPKIIRPGLLV